MLSLKQTRPGKKVPCYDGSKSVLAKRYHAFVKANAFLYPGSHATMEATPSLLVDALAFAKAQPPVRQNRYSIDKFFILIHNLNTFET